MDDVLIDAYRRLNKTRPCSADEILCDPTLRGEFLADARRALGSDKAERDILARLSALRKRSRLPRSREFRASG